MKVLFVINSLGAGGAEYSQKSWWMNLLSRGVDVRIVILKKREVGISNILPSELKQKCRMLQGNFLQQLIHLNSIIREFQPDIVHSTLWSANLRSRLIKIINGNFLHIESLVNTTYVRERFTDPNVVPWKIKIIKQIDALTAPSGVDAWHAITKTVAEHHVDVLGIPEDKIRVIPRGRRENDFIHDEKNRQQIRNRFELEDDEILIIQVGRQEYQKGQDQLIEALGQLKKNNPWLQYKVLLLGREGHMTSRLETLITQYGLEQTVFLTGHRYDLEQVMAAADLFVFPSRYEGQGGALIEAMASQLPVICPDRPVFREVLGKEYIQHLYAIDSDNTLARKLESWIKNKTLRIEASQLAWNRFQNKYQIKDIHSRMMSWYEELIKERHLS